MSRSGNLVVILLLLLAGAGLTTSYFLWGRLAPAKTREEVKPSPTPTASFRTKWGKVDLFFQSPNYPVRKSSEPAYEGEVFQGERYILDGDPIRNFYIGYYSSREELQKRTDFYKDGDENRAGLGCYSTNDEVRINGVTFQKTSCYYNPIGVTSLGKHIPGVSVEAGNECIYWIDREKTEALYFWAVAEEGHDTCTYLEKELRDLRIEYKDMSRKMIGVVRWSGLAEEEKQRFELTTTNYQLTDFPSGSEVRGYFIKGDLIDLDKMEGKCVEAAGKTDSDWERNHNLKDSYQRSVLVVRRIDPASNSLCRPYEEKIVDESPMGIEELNLDGTLERERRPTPYVGYDYVLRLRKAYTDNLSAIGYPQAIRTMVIVPGTNKIWGVVEEKIGKEVSVRGYLRWGYAESKFLLVVDIE